MNIYEKLLAIQCELKAPKSQYNSFGKYNYRNCEDIVEAAKPICKKYNAVFFLSDDIEFVDGRHYVKATVTFVDCEKPDSKIVVSANAREEEDKKGMDGSQVTGASSSYARKYALNGLFDIDDTKDSDTTNHGDNGDKKPTRPNNTPTTQQPKSSQQEMSLDEAKKVCFASGNQANIPFGDLKDNQLKWVAQNSKGKYQQAAAVILMARQEEQQSFVKELQEDNGSDEVPF